MSGATGRLATPVTRRRARTTTAAEWCARTLQVAGCHADSLGSACRVRRLATPVTRRRREDNNCSRMVRRAAPYSVAGCHADSLGSACQTCRRLATPVTRRRREGTATAAEWCGEPHPTVLPPPSCRPPQTSRAACATRPIASPAQGSAALVASGSSADRAHAANPGPPASSGSTFRRSSNAKTTSGGSSTIDRIPHAGPSTADLGQRQQCLDTLGGRPNASRMSSRNTRPTPRSSGSR